MGVTLDVIETPSLGDRSYVVGDGTSAAVVDPQRDIDRILAVVEDRGLAVRHVVETHVHNDYVSGGLALADETGAEYHLPAGSEADFAHSAVRDGTRLRLGDVELVAHRTPGHTPHHTSYVVRCDHDVAVLTGGSMLHGTVGRTDLVSAATAEELTRAQYRSVRRLADALDDDVAVHPTHGFGSFCSSAPADTDGSSTVGRERTRNIALTTDDEDAFVARILDGLGAFPRYYAHMGPRNRVGPAAIDLAPPPSAGSVELAVRMRAGEWVLDLRPRDVFAAAHVRGTVNAELTDGFVASVGWILPWGLPLTLIAPDAATLTAAQRELVRIGIDRPAAAAVGEVAGIAGDLPVGSYEVRDFAALAAALDGATPPVVVDVRRAEEWEEGHVRGAVHVPLQKLERSFARVPEGVVWVHCASGYRASVAASLLARAGRDVVLVDDALAIAPDERLVTG